MIAGEFPAMDKALHQETIMIRAQVEQVTPKQAATYLKHFKLVQRRLRPSMVDYLAEEIKCNRFETTHQGLAFFDDGTGADGHHRLHAIIKANKTVKILVTRGLKRKAGNAIDTGTARTPDDVLRLNGRDYGVGAGGVIKHIVSGMEGSRGKLSNQVILDLADRYGHGLLFVAKVMGATNVPGVTVAPVKSVVVRAYFARPQQRPKLERFMEILVQGYKAQKASGKEDPAFALRELLHRQPGIRGTMLLKEVYAKTERALKSFLDDEPLDKIYATKWELFPLPGENEDMEIDKEAVATDGPTHFLIPVTGRGGESGRVIVQRALKKGIIRIGKNCPCRNMMKQGDRACFVISKMVIGDASIEGVVSNPRAGDDAFPHEVKLNGTRVYYERPVEITYNKCARLSGFKGNPNQNMMATLLRSVRPVTAGDFKLLTTQKE